MQTETVPHHLSHATVYYTQLLLIKQCYTKFRTVSHFYLILACACLFQQTSPPLSMQALDPLLRSQLVPHRKDATGTDLLKIERFPIPPWLALQLFLLSI